VTQLQLILDLDLWAVWITFMVAVLFPLVTAFFWPWWTSGWGWNIVTLESAIALALLPAWLHYVFGFTAVSYPFRWVQVGSIMAVAFIIVWRSVLIWITQRVPAVADYDELAAVLRRQGYTVLRPGIQAEPEPG
jgi:hypothetical protein